MDLYYAVGAGLGHVNRARLIIEKLSLKNILVICSNEVAIPLLCNLSYHLISPDFLKSISSLRKELNKLVELYRPKKIFLDTFPCGLIGEWFHSSSIDYELYLVTRILKVASYKKVVQTTVFPRLSKIYLCEEISQKQIKFLHQLTSKVNIERLELNHTLRINVGKSSKVKIKLPLSYWLIIHSGKLEECMVLWQHANDIATLENKKPNIYFIHPKPEIFKDISGVAAFSTYKILELASNAGKIFTACGFNLMHELLPMRHKHIFIPFDRKFDDQFLRAKLFRHRK